MTYRYAWMRFSNNGLPESKVGIPFFCVTIVPGMGQWVLVHLHPTEELPSHLISTDKVQEMLSCHEPI